MKHKKAITIGVIVLAVSFILIALFNSTYAMFSSDDYADKSNSYSTGLLSIVASSKSDNISLTDALPITDEEGIQTDPYVFTIKNIGNLDFKFDVKLLASGENNFLPQYIKLQIDNGDVTTLSAINSVIKSGITLRAGESIDISIRIWLSIDTPNTEIGKVFNSKIVTDGQAVYTSTNTPINTISSYIKDLYSTSNPTLITTPSNGMEYYYASAVGLMNDGLDNEGNRTNDIKTDGNIRYYGNNPSNYIYFNCSNYNNQTSDTCELWRIIGIFDGKVKIVKDDALGSFAWDYTSSAEYNNNWHDSTLMSLLNNSYYNSSDNVTYYNYGSTVNLNFGSNKTGIKNEITQKLISDSTWYLGNGGDTSDAYANVIYAGERGNEIGTNTSKTWNGKIALMYPSDYGFAADLSLCTSTLNKYSDANCTSNNWLYIGDKEWIISPTPNNNDANVWTIYDTGYVHHNTLPRAKRTVRPTLYLESDVRLLGGDGTSSNPYEIYAIDDGYKGNAVEYISKLYNNNKDSVATNNSIKYQYASSVGLMNDRLGGVTRGFDDGNIRYYGANPNNYVNLGDYNYVVKYGWQILSDHYDEEGYTSYEQCVEGQRAEYNWGINEKCYGFDEEWLEEKGYASIQECLEDPNDHILGYYPNLIEEKCGELIITDEVESNSLYRIIGVFKDVELSDGSKEDLIKVIRDDSIGKLGWDSKTTGIGTAISDYGSNDWTDAQLMMLLNPGYERYNPNNPFKDTSGNIIYGYEGSLWWNSKKSTCYGFCYETSDDCNSECNFTNIGLDNQAKNKIETVVWDLGGYNATNVFSNVMYTGERDGIIYDDVKRARKWEGKVALMYASDYGYATDFNKCSKILVSYDDDSSCVENDWLYMESVAQWQLSSLPGMDSYGCYIDQNGGGDTGQNMMIPRAVRPVFYLKAESVIESGIGSIENPYVIR